MAHGGIIPQPPVHPELVEGRASSLREASYAESLSFRDKRGRCRARERLLPGRVRMDTEGNPFGIMQFDESAQ